MSDIQRTILVPDPPTSNHPHKPLVDASNGSIIYTETDEAPALATFNLLPIFTKFAAMANIDVIPCDISLAGRVIAAFPERLTPEQRKPDNLAYLGQMCTSPDANIIKLPNISASVPQLQDCIKELRSKGYDVPLFPQEPQTPEEHLVRSQYAKVLGSAVNPVLRQGNSDRHTAPVVKEDAQHHPNKLMKPWSKANRTHVSHMDKGDFYGSEQSAVMSKPSNVTIELVNPEDGYVLKVLKKDLALQQNEVIDATFMDVQELCKYYEREIQDAKNTNILLSLHLKATMMKVSDPILFGHCLRTYFKDAFDKHQDVLEEIGAHPKNGLRTIFALIKEKLSPDKAAEVMSDFEACYETRPGLAMVNSDEGVTNLHVPSDIIVDNSMPVVIRDGGHMWNKAGKLEEAKCLIPDRSYSTMYQEVISYVKSEGQFDCTTMGNISNVGLMSHKAEEYGSHDKTFEVPADGTIRVRDIDTNKVYMSHAVHKGDVWRMCQTKDEAIRDWVHLACERARETGSKTIFWLDPKRAHDSEIMKKVELYLKDNDASNLDISVMPPVLAVRVSMERARDGLDTISVTGNVLRDYLTDLFPILELGTSAKVLSIVPLLAGGGLYETGAGGSAPKHVQQFVKCDHLRWNSLGEYQAMAEAFARLGKKKGAAAPLLLSECLYKAIGIELDKNEMPARRVHQLDNRDTNFLIALKWAEFLSKEDDHYKVLYQQLAENRDAILAEISQSQGPPTDLGGYYLFDYKKAKMAMNPSKLLTQAIESVEAGQEPKDANLESGFAAEKYANHIAQ